jgi:hypothetical protein
MPYDIRRNYRGKSGYSVVGPDGKSRGTHPTRSAAIEQQRALYAAEARMKKGEEESNTLYDQLTPDEKDFHDVMMMIVEKHGKIDEDGSGIWAGYNPPDENPDSQFGVKCGNCSHFEGGNMCHIIALPVNENGICRFAAIPDGYVNYNVMKGDFWQGRFTPKA